MPPANIGLIKRRNNPNIIKHVPDIKSGYFVGICFIGVLFIKWINLRSMFHLKQIYCIEYYGNNRNRI